MKTLLSRALTVTLLAAAVLWNALGAAAQEKKVPFGNETLNYQVVFQWGMIWKHAGDAKLTLRKTGTGYQAQLVGSSRSWIDKFYTLRDTLRCNLNNNLSPLRYEKLTHEGNYHARDVVDFSYGYYNTYAKCARYRAGRETVRTELSAQCPAYDMLSVFYMLRMLDLDRLKQDGSFTTVIFSGKEKEYLTLRYKKREQVKLRDGSRHDAHHIVFKFTQKDRKKSSDDIDVWLSTDERHIPLLLVGHLEVGQIKCYCVL